MISNSKINCLIIPDLFPDNEKDIKGIFMRDYIASTEPLCNNKVLVLKLTGTIKGVSKTTLGNTPVLKYTFYDKKIPKILKPFNYFRYILKGYSLYKKEKDIQIIHAHGSILSGTIAYLLSRKLKVPFVVTEHAGPFSIVTSSKWKYKWTKFILQKADAILNVSEHAQNDIIKSGIFPRKTFVTFNPINTSRFTISPGKEKSFLFFSRLDNFKGALRCLKIFHSLYKNYPDWKFVVIGEGEDLPAMQQFLLENPELKSQVDLKGQIGREEIAKQMAKSAFFLFPSLHETFGIVAAEALSCGVPVIATNKTAPKEFVNERNGILVDPQNDSEIKAAIENMISNYSRYSPQKLREEMIDRFGPEKFGERLYSVYLDTISNFKN